MYVVTLVIQGFPLPIATTCNSFPTRNVLLDLIDARHEFFLTHAKNVPEGYPNSLLPLLNDLVPDYDPLEIESGLLALHSKSISWDSLICQLAIQKVD
jgi:hypothetical protein